MMKNRLLKFALINFILAVLTFVITYFFFHYVTDAGITGVKQEEAGKPLVTYLFGVLGTLFLFSSITSVLASFVLVKKED